MCVTLFLLLASLGAGGSFPANPLAKPGWALDAHDEFDGPELNTRLWSPFYLESRTDRRRSAARYEFRSGCLVLFSDGRTPGYWRDGGDEMTASSIQTGDDTGLHKPQKFHHDIPRRMLYAPRYGYFEIRARLPPDAYAVFWLIGARDGIANSGEIDVFETVKDAPGTLKFAMHPWDDKRLAGKSLRPEPGFDPGAGFHLYALEWTRDDCVLYYDNRRILAMGQAPNYPCIILLTLQGSTSRKTRTEFAVDYFRAYKREGEPLTPGADMFR